MPEAIIPPSLDTLLANLPAALIAGALLTIVVSVLGNLALGARTAIGLIGVGSYLITGSSAVLSLATALGSMLAAERWAPKLGTTSSDNFVRRPDGVLVCSRLAIAVGAWWLAGISSVPGYLLAAGVAGLAAASGIDVCRAVDRNLSANRYTLPSLRRLQPNAQHGVTAAGAAWGLLAVVAVTGVARQTNLIGPGEAALVLLAAAIALVMDDRLHRSASGGSRFRDRLGGLLTTGLAALIAACLIASLP